jgi:hypothetical protein
VVAQKQILNEQKSKSKLNLDINHLKGNTNQPIMPVNHKVEFEAEVCHFLEDQHRQLAPDTKSTILCNILYERDFMNGIIFKQVMMKSIDHYHDHMFPDCKLLMAMDEHGGTLNYTAVEILCTLEREYWVAAGLFNKKCFKSMLPSKLDLHRAAKRIEVFADNIVPVTRFSTPSGEGFKFSDVHNKLIDY